MNYCAKHSMRLVKNQTCPICPYPARAGDLVEVLRCAYPCLGMHGDHVGVVQTVGVLWRLGVRGDGIRSRTAGCSVLVDSSQYADKIVWAVEVRVLQRQEAS